MSKIILAGVNTRHTHSSLSLACLQAYLAVKPKQADVVRCDFDMNQGLEAIVANLILQKPAIIGFATYIWNVQMVLSIAGALKEAVPGVAVILGGPEVSFENEDILSRHPWIDAVIRGEGEVTFWELVGAIVQNAGMSGIHGVSWQKGGEIHHEPDREQIADLDSLPSPFLTGVYGNGNGFTYYEASRGCPFSCAYCLSSVLGRLRCFSLPRVLEELDWFMQSDYSQIRFADRTFNYDQARARAILEHILRNNRQGKKFHFELKPDLIDDSLIDLLADADPEQFHLEIGIQSTDACALEEVARRQDHEKLVKNILSLKERTGCHVHLDMLAGMPGETFAGFRKSLDEAFSWGADTIQVGLVKVLKGTALRKRVKAGALHCMPHPPYAVVRSDWLSAEEVIHVQEIGKLVEGMFNGGRFSGTLNLLMQRFFGGSPADFFSALGLFWRRSGRVFFSFGPDTVVKGLTEFLATLSTDDAEKEAILGVAEHERRLTQKVPAGKQGECPFPASPSGQGKTRITPGFRYFWYSRDPLALLANPLVSLDSVKPAPVWYAYETDLSTVPKTTVLEKSREERYALAWLAQSTDFTGFTRFLAALFPHETAERDLREIWEMCSNSGIIHFPGTPRKIIS